MVHPPYRRTLIGFTAREWTYELADGSAGEQEPFEEAFGPWIEGPEAEEEEDLE